MKFTQNTDIMEFKKHLESYLSHDDFNDLNEYLRKAILKQNYSDISKLISLLDTDKVNYKHSVAILRTICASRLCIRKYDYFVLNVRNSIMKQDDLNALSILTGLL
jgi:hypothetical protein